MRGYKDSLVGVPGSMRHSAGSFAVIITNGLETITESFASGGEIYVANGNAVPSVGDIIEMTEIGDFSGSQLATAKGEAVRPFDYFQVTSVAPGSEALTYLGNLRIPAMAGFGDTVTTEMQCSKLETKITRIGGTAFTAALVNHYFLWPDGKRDRIAAYNNASELTVDDSGYYSSSPGCKVQGKIYASINFKRFNVIVVLSANRLYVSNTVPITGWKEVDVISSIRPSQIFSRFFEDNNCLILTNGAGLYRIVFDDTSTIAPYAYRLNEPLPHNFPVSVPVSAGLTNGYRLTYSLSRIIAPSYTMDRTNAADGAVLQHESGTIALNTVSGKDYAEAWCANAIAIANPLTWTLFEPQQYGPYHLSQHFTHYSLYRTKNINVASLTLGNQKELFVWVKDVPIAKAFICSRTAAGVVTATSGFFAPEDVGCVLIYYDGTLDTITAYTSNTEVAVSPSTDKASQAASLGADVAFTISQTGTTITVTGKTLLSSEEGRQIFISNGKIVVIKKVLSTSTAIVNVSTSYTSLGGTINPSGRKITDTTSDEVLQTRIESGSALYFLQSRFFVPLPSTNLGVINAGQLLVAISGENRYYYCNTSKEQLTGYYHPEKMKNEKITDSIQQLRSYQGRIVIRCTNSTWALVTSVSAEGGDVSLGESYSVLGDPECVDETIGSIGDTSSKVLSNGVEIVWTTEPAIRTFDGFKYGANLAENSVMTEVRKYNPDIRISFSPSDGIHFWGDQEV